MNSVKYYDAPTLRGWDESSLGFRVVEADDYDALAAENERLKAQIAAMELATSGSQSDADSRMPAHQQPAAGEPPERAWIEHGPSKGCPFISPYTSKVDVRLRNGTVKLNDLACNFGWFWREHDPQDYDVVAFRAPASSASQAQPPAAVANGWALVPVEPTPQMLAHWRKGRVINAAVGSQEKAEAAAVKRWHDLLAVAAVPAAPQKYDDVLLPFLAMMRAELHANAGKGDRAGWLQMDVPTALLELFYHMGKLQKAAKKGDAGGVREYTADVANMAMMLADIHGLLPEHPVAPESAPDDGAEWSIVPVGSPPVELVLWNALVECRSAIGTNFRVTSREAALAAIAEAMAFQQSAQQAEPEQPARAEARVVGFKPGMSQVTLELEAGPLPSWMDMGFPVTVIAAEGASDE